MNTEEKAKAYDEALEKAKGVYQRGYYISGDIESIFPELKESEDDQHRKWILEYLYDGLRKSDEQFKNHFKAAIAWLEKQKEPELSEDLGEYITELSKQFPEVSFAKLSRIAVRVKNWFEKQGEQNMLLELQKNVLKIS